MKRLIIVDPNLIDYRGHHAEYGLAVAEAALDAGLSPSILGHESCELGGAPTDIEILRTFTDRPYAYTPASWIRDLSAALADMDVSEGDHVFVHTMSPRELEQLTIAVCSGLVTGAPTYHLLFRRDANEYDAYDRLVLSEYFRNEAVTPAVKERFRFYTDTPQLTAQHDGLTALSDKRFTTLPIPFRHRLLSEPGKARSRPLTVTYLGDARQEKGYPALAGAVRELLDASSEPLSVLVQSNFNTPDGEEGVVESRDALAAMRSRGVRLLQGPFAPPDYHELLAQSDIVMLPYDAERYARRSSGILAETLAMGKIPVVPVGTWLSAEAGEGAVTYVGSENLGAALIEAVQRHDELRPVCLARSRRFLEAHSPQALVATLLSSRVPRNRVAKPRVLWVVPSHPVDFGGKVGSGRVASAQLDFLRQNDFEVCALLVESEDHSLIQGPPTQSAEADAFLEGYGVKKVWRVRLPPAWLSEGTDASVEYRRLRTENACRDFSIDHDVRLRKLLHLPESLRAECASQPFDLCLVNYAFNQVLVSRLGLHDVPTICEMHDVMSEQYAFANEKDPDPKDFELECDLLSQADVVACINAEEKRRLSSVLKGVDLFDVVPPAATAPSGLAELAGLETMLDVVQACGPLDESVFHHKREDMSRESTVDMILVSSYHPPTLTSLRWFYEDVYIPYLKPAGLNVLVLGSIVDGGVVKPLGDDRFYFAGKVDVLGPAHAAAKMSVLPITQGAGTAIKTLEAINEHLPMVGTSMAFRGLSSFGLDFSPWVADEPRAFAEKVIELAGNPDLRRKRVEEARFFSAEVGSRRRYMERYGKAVDSIVPGFAHRSVPVQEARTDEGLVELSPTSALFSAGMGLARA